MATANYYIHLNGSSQHWAISDNASFDYATGDAFTFGLWFRRDWDDNNTRSYLWSRENQHEMWIESDELVYYFNGAGGAVTWYTGVYVVPEAPTLLVLTGAESTNTTLKLYINGYLRATKTIVGGMPSDTDTGLYFGVDYDTTAAKRFKGTMTGWFQSNDTAISPADVLTAWNSGVYDIDTTEAITGLDDSIGFEENTGTDYDNALNAGVDGAGTGTPIWLKYLDAGIKAYKSQLHLTGVGECIGFPIVIEGIEWKGDTIGDGDEVILTDRAGRIVWDRIATADDTGFNWYPSEPIGSHGLIVNTLGHGVLDVRYG